MKERRKILIGIGISGVILVLLGILITTTTRKKGKIPEVVRQEEGAGAREKVEERKEPDVQREGKTALPVEVVEFGWRPVSRTIPVSGFIWEWATELENKTPLNIKVAIKFQLLDENDTILAKALGGDDLGPGERKIIIGRAAADDRIMNTRKMKVELEVSPSTTKNSPEDIQKNWIWSTPFEIKKERNLGYQQ